MQPAASPLTAPVSKDLQHNLSLCNPTLRAPKSVHGVNGNLSPSWPYPTSSPPSPVVPTWMLESPFSSSFRAGGDCLGAS